jgi:hypothetical protein
MQQLRPDTLLSKATNENALLLEESEEGSSSDYSVTGTTRSDIEIMETDPQGQFVKFTNKSNKVNGTKTSEFEKSDMRFTFIKVNLNFLSNITFYN